MKRGLSQNRRVKSTSGRTGGRSNEKTQNIPEFHPRGSAGHREIYTSKAHHKAVLPYAGKGVKHPKTDAAPVLVSRLGGSSGHREIYVQKSHHKAGIPSAVKGLKNPK
jgi:hypothetical protein